MVLVCRVPLALVSPAACPCPASLVAARQEVQQFRHHPEAQIRKRLHYPVGLVFPPETNREYLLGILRRTGKFRKEKPFLRKIELDWPSETLRVVLSVATC